jgi:hypothetical protein
VRMPRVRASVSAVLGIISPGTYFTAVLLFNTGMAVRYTITGIAHGHLWAGVPNASVSLALIALWELGRNGSRLWWRAQRLRWRGQWLRWRVLRQGTPPRLQARALTQRELMTAPRGHGTRRQRA